MLKCRKSLKSDLTAQAEKKKKTHKEPTVILATPLVVKKKKHSKRNNKKSLEALLSFQKRLVEEKGLPPSRLMLEQAASTSQPSKPTQESAPEESHTEHQKADELVKEPTQVQEANDKDSGKNKQETKFKCPPCQNIFKSKHTLAIHVYFSQGKGSGSRADFKCQLCDDIEGSCKDITQDAKNLVDM